MVLNNMSTESLLRKIIIGGLFLVPFLPFVVSGSLFFPFITGKNFAFRIIVEILFALWLILVFFDKNYLPKKNNLFLAVGSFVGIIALADIFGVNFYKSFWSNYERMEGLVSLLHIFAYFVLLVSIFNEKIWKRYFSTIFFVSVGLILYGILQLLGKAEIHQSGTRLDASFGNSAYFAVHMLIIAFLSALYMMRGRLGNNFNTWFYGGVGIASAFMVVQTATRGSVIGLILGFIVASSLVLIFGEENQKKIAKYILGGIFTVIVLFMAMRNLPFIKNSPSLGRFSDLTISTIMNQPRYMVWNMAWKGFKEHPVLGWGQENFNIVFNKYYDPKMWGQEPWFDRAHDVFFDWLIAGGILGLISYLSIFVFALIFIWKKNLTKKLTVVDRSILTGLFVGYFVHNIFVFDNLLSYVMFFTVVAYVYNESRNVPDDVGEKEKKPAPLITEEFNTYIAISLVIFSSVFSLYFINIKPMLASNTLIYALSSRGNSADEFNASLDNFKKVFTYKTFGTTEGREQLVQRAMGIARAQGIDPMIKQNFFVAARDEMGKQIEKNPNDARYRVFMGALFSANSMPAESLIQFEKARELSPNKQTIMFELVSANLNKGDIPKALEIAKQAYDLDPSFEEARKIYAVAATYAGNNALAKELTGLDVVPDDRFINAYVATNQYKKVIEIWKLRIASDPNNPQYHVYLAATYLADKQRDKSIAELKKAAELNPAFKEQAEFYIKEIRAGRNPK